MSAEHSKHDQPLAFLHTGEGHVAGFQRLVDDLAPGTPTRHLVREDLLRQAEAAGGPTPEILQRAEDELTGLADDGAGTVLLTCSTIGAAAENAAPKSKAPILRVDRPMAERAVAAGERLAVVACVQTTIAPTVSLLEKVAQDFGKSAELNVHLLDHAWPYFLAGDQNTYLSLVAKGLRLAADENDAVVIAQASMAGAVRLCPDVDVPLLSSPRLGVKAALAAWRQATTPAS